MDRESAAVYFERVSAGGDIIVAGTVIQPQAERPALFVNVPALPNQFIGRDNLVTTLVQRLIAGGHPALSAEGLPGVGKTAMAVILAHHPHVLGHFADGVLWAGLGTQPDVMGQLGIWVEALGLDVSQLVTVARRAGAVKNAIGLRRMLLVIDDAWQIDAAKQMRCGGPNCGHILTTRDHETARSFAGAHNVVKLPVLEDDAAFDLLRAIAPEACAVDPNTARQLSHNVGGLPLALELLGGYLAVPERSIFPELVPEAMVEMADPAMRLSLAQTRLGAHRGVAVTLRDTIALSLSDLPEATVMAFYALGAFAPKPATFSTEAALAVTRADHRTLATLVARNLLERGDDHLALHQTIADVARDHKPADATERHRDFYVALVNEDHEDWKRIEVAYPQVQWAWQVSEGQEGDGRLELIWALQVFQSQRGLWLDCLDWARVGLKRAEETDQPGDAATLLNNLGRAYSALGDNSQALEYFTQALPLFRQVRNPVGEATTLNNVGMVYNALGDKSQAMEYLNHALPLFRQVDNPDGEATTLNNIGLVYGALGDQPKALEYFTQALPLFCQVGNPYGEAMTLNNIGMVYGALGDKSGVSAH